MDQANPYNFPFPSRKDLMSLSTIHEGKRALIKPSLNMQVDDIEGARGRLRGYSCQQREPSSLTTRIEGLPDNWRKVKVQSNSLRIDDIQGAKPKAANFRTNRMCNPLEPVYELPSYPEASLEPPRKFMRDTLDITDIPTKNTQRLKKQPFLPDEVRGSTTTKPKQPIMDTRGDKYNVKDINTAGFFTTNRRTDVLEPTYRWQDQEDLAPNETYTDPKEFKGRLRHPEVVNKKNDSNINVDDILGTKANSFYDRMFFLAQRRHPKDSMRVDDIPKAEASSLRKGITTVRQTNPLTPAYKYPGASTYAPSLTQRLDRFITTK